MNISRRRFLGSAASSGVGLLVPAVCASASAPPASSPNTGGQRPFKLGIATYSYWHFSRKKFPIETVVNKAAELGVEGVDVLHRQLETEDGAYLRKLKRHAFLNGIALICLSMHQSFVSSSAEVRERNVKHTLKCLNIASQLGIPSMRINAGTWGTTKNFNVLMKNRGIEPVPPGVTEEDGYRWVSECIRKCLPRAEELGVILALENHWGLSGTPEGMLRIFREINSPWLQLLPDTGNFLENPYEKLATVFPHACYVQAKTYFGGGEWYSLDLDYKRIFRQLRDAGYKGYVGIEFEGKAPADEGVPKSIALLRDAMA